MNSTIIEIIGGGLAGSEAALTLSRLGIECRVHEMRPSVMTPAHRTSNLAELVCSNSFGSSSPLKAKGLLLRELEMAGASLPGIFRKYAVPAGQAFAVDQALASAEITETIAHDSNIELTRGEMKSWPGEPSIIATGPLTSPEFMLAISGALGSDFLHFFDAISPSIFLDSIDMSHAFYASRYGYGGDDYLNIPLNEFEYNRLVDDLLDADRVEIREFEPDKLFEACLPVEVIASRGREALAFGPLKPKGLANPATGKNPFAVMQLRRETISGDVYNIVGFQTRLTQGAQKALLRKLPALANARFARYGMMHINAYLDAPELLNTDLSLKKFPHTFIAGQLAGGEGYLEAIATGFYAARNIAMKLTCAPEFIPPAATMSGALLAALTSAPAKHFNPVQAQFGLLPPPAGKIRGKKERERIRARIAIDNMNVWLKSMGIEPGATTDIDDG